MKAEAGFCECGCGGKTTFPRETNRKAGVIRGFPNRFLPGHNKYNGGIDISFRPDGYILLKKRDHISANSNNGYYVYAHKIVVEQVLGRRLKKPETIHHFNGKKLDNNKNNLVVCQNQAYHMLLHKRERALCACGHADWEVCCYCHKYDHPDNLSKYKKSAYHRKCNIEHCRKSRENKL